MNTRKELIEKAHKIMESDQSVKRGGAAIQVTNAMNVDDILEFLRSEVSDSWYSKRALKMSQMVISGEMTIGDFRCEVINRLMDSEKEVI